MLTATQTSLLYVSYALIDGLTAFKKYLSCLEVTPDRYHVAIVQGTVHRKTFPFGFRSMHVNNGTTVHDINCVVHRPDDITHLRRDDGPCAHMCLFIAIDCSVWGA